MFYVNLKSITLQSVVVVVVVVAVVAVAVVAVAAVVVVVVVVVVLVVVLVECYIVGSELERIVSHAAKTEKIEKQFAARCKFSQTGDRNNKAFVVLTINRWIQW